MQTLKLGKNMGYGERNMSQMADIFRTLNAPKS